MKKSTQLGLMFFSLPFVMSASIEFLPQWLSWPIGVIAAMFWVGTIVEIQNYDKTEEKEDETYKKIGIGTVLGILVHKLF